ncbi:MAG: PatB family C-S lyase [Candidatus Lokiarchaeota archaeon]|nr:PatB family C-S lyase [Candidatus Lokiarchaeota archaeon]
MAFSISQFDKIIDRTQTWSLKWDPDYMKERFNRTDLLPFNHAEMDFECPKPVINAIKRRASHGIYGYTLVKDEYYNCIVDWFNKRHSISYKREDLQFGTGIISSYRTIINHFTIPKDNVLILTPIYRPFIEGVEEYGRKVVRVPLFLENDKYLINFDLLERIFEKKKIKMLALCNPHNPVGRVWNERELRKLGDLCVSHNTLIVSDDIHSDLTAKDHAYVPITSISEDISNITITLTSPSKTFNLSGLKISNYHITNPEIRNRFYPIIDKKFVYAPNVFAITALMVAYTECEEYANLLTQYLDENYSYIENYIIQNDLKIKVIKREGTPTIWLDFREIGIPHDKIFSFLLDQANLISVDGQFYGDEGFGFQRLSIGLPRSIVQKAMQNLRIASDSLNAISNRN